MATNVFLRRLHNYAVDMNWLKPQRNQRTDSFNGVAMHIDEDGAFATADVLQKHVQEELTLAYARARHDMRAARSDRSRNAYRLGDSPPFACTVQKSVSERTLDVCRIRHWQEAIDPEAGLPGKGFGFFSLVRCAEALGHQAAIRDSAIHQGQGIFSSKASGGLLEPVMVQKATQCLLGLHLGRQCRFGGIVEIQRNHVAKALMRPARVVMFFNRGEDPPQVGLA